MANPQLQAGGFANGTLIAVDSNGNQQSVSSLTAAIDQYTLAYVAAVGASPTNHYCVVARATLPTGTTTVNVTFNSKSLDGTALPPLVLSYDLAGPVAPQAVSLQKQSEGYGTGTPPASDPGSASITMI